MRSLLEFRDKIKYYYRQYDLSGGDQLINK